MIKEQVFRETVDADFSIEMGAVINRAVEVKISAPMVQIGEDISAITVRWASIVDETLIKEVKNLKCLSVCYLTLNELRPGHIAMEIRVACCSSPDDEPFPGETHVAIDMDEQRAMIKDAGGLGRWLESRET